MTPKTLNVAGFQVRPNSGINFTCEFLRDPIETATVLPILIIRPDIEAKHCKVCTHEQNDPFLPSRIVFLSSENCDSSISSSRIFIP